MRSVTSSRASRSPTTRARLRICARTCTGVRLIAFFTDVIDPVAQSAVLAELGSLAKRHVVLCIFMNDAVVSASARAYARDDR